MSAKWEIVVSPHTYQPIFELKVNDKQTGFYYSLDNLQYQIRDQTEVMLEMLNSYKIELNDVADAFHQLRKVANNKGWQERYYETTRD